MASSRAAHIAILAVEALTMLFWFAGFIALSVFVSRLLVCGGMSAGLFRLHVYLVLLVVSRYPDLVLLLR
jgi:hypothetical protein